MICGWGGRGVLFWSLRMPHIIDKMDLTQFLKIRDIGQKRACSRKREGERKKERKEREYDTMINNFAINPKSTFLANQYNTIFK